MAEAYSKDWRRPKKTFNLTHDSGQSCRITGTIRKEDAIRGESQDIVGGRPRWNHGNPTAQRAQVAKDVVFDTEVVGDHVKGFPIRSLYMPDGAHRIKRRTLSGSQVPPVARCLLF